MVLTPSSEAQTGSPAPAFSLPEPNSSVNVGLQDFQNRPFMLVFMCNHCPYVVHILDGLVAAAHTLTERGISTIAISANNVITHPADSPEKMAELSKSKNFPFPYLYDETQEVARSYGAQCTPDFYLYDKNHTLYYRGQFDSARPGGDVKVTGDDMINAARLMMAGEPSPTATSPSIGCSIKWKEA